MQRFVLNPPMLALPKRAILRRLGYPADVEPTGHLGDIWMHMLKEAKSLLQFKAVLAVLEVEKNEGETVCFKASSWQIESTQVARLLSECQHAGVLVCTVGPELERQSLRYTEESQVTEGVLLDAIGSETADAVADWVHHQAWKNFAYPPNARAVTPRFSPGYGDWPLASQGGLMATAGAATLGVTLNESWLMHPRKSVSAVFGFKLGEAV